MCKIAFNYALDNGINVDKLLNNVDIKCEFGKVKEIMFRSEGYIIALSNSYSSRTLKR